MPIELQETLLSIREDPLDKDNNFDVKLFFIVFFAHLEAMKVQRNLENLIDILRLQQMRRRIGNIYWFLVLWSERVLDDKTFMAILELWKITTRKTIS